VDWLELVGPSAAILALFAVVGLVVQSIRHGRAIRRLEDRVAQAGSAAVEAPLERIQQLQTRAAVSSGEGRRLPPGALRKALLSLGVVALVVAAGLGGWFALSRGGDDGGAAEGPTATLEEDAGQPTVPADPGTVPDEPAPVANPSQFQVAVFNGSGVSGAAGDVVAPRLSSEGWQVPDALIVNEPNGRTDVAATLVQWNQGARDAAVAVAQDLGVDDASPLDGYTDEQIGGADVLVVVGQDLASEVTG
jgi:LytR cell envelope-related transcriptional attenuator